MNVGITTGGQGEYAKVTQAEGSLVKTDGMPDDSLLPSLLTLSDVLPTGWHCAVAAGVKPGDTVVVVGDGAVGLCAVLAAAQLGAERVVAMSRHEDRQQIARQFGATDIVAERGKEGAARIKEMTGGVGADAVLECVGTNDSMAAGLRFGPARLDRGLRRAFRTASTSRCARCSEERRAGRRDGAGAHVPPASCSTWSPPATVDPGLVFDLRMPLDQVAEGYRAMDERPRSRSTSRSSDCSAELGRRVARRRQVTLHPEHVVPGAELPPDPRQVPTGSKPRRAVQPFAGRVRQGHAGQRGQVATLDEPLEQAS